MEIETIIEMLFWMVAIYLLPGWAFLSFTRFWQKFSPLQRWILAIAISIAFFPLLFYFSRELLPELHIGRNKLMLMFLLLLGLIIYFQRKDWRKQFAFSGLEWLGIGIFAGTILIRFSLAYRFPVPAWSDSLHHTLITQLTALHGQLPYTLDPYEPSQLNMYHLGLYSLTGSLQILSGMPAHSALLWTAQLLNGLCGIGIYFLLDRMVGRKAAIIGALVVGFYSFQPNWYFNWGRFTQLSSQTILLIAWGVTWETVRSWRENTSEDSTLTKWAWVITSSLLNASIFLLHFRVAGYYLPLLLITIIYEGVRSIKVHSFSRMLVNTLLIGLFSLILITPAVVPAVFEYVQRSQSSVATQSDASEDPDPTNEYYGYTLESVYAIGAKKWMIWLSAAALVVSLFTYPRMSIILILWSGLLWLEGNAYRLGIPLLSFTNYTAIMIFYYIPIGLILGMAGEAILKLPWLKGKSTQIALLGSLVLIAIFAGRQRANDIEPFRFFVTGADLEAMNWIRANTEEDALFAINTFMWLGNSPHGTDGGYWIPYFTDRKTTTGTMMYTLGSADYVKMIRNLSTLTFEATTDPGAVAKLARNGVDYIYIGPMGSFTGQGLNPDSIAASSAAQLVYSKNGVDIFKVNP